MISGFVVVCPIFRNGRSLEELISRVLALQGARLILVEDGSGEQLTLDVLERCCGPRVGAVVFEKNRSQHAAIYSGLELACRFGEPVVVMDGDLQDRPEHIPELLANLELAPVVFSQRIQALSWSSWLFKEFLRLLSGFRLPSQVGTFVALRPEVCRYLVDTQMSPPYLVGHLGLSGFALSAVSQDRQSSGGVSSYTWTGRWRLAATALWQRLNWPNSRLTVESDLPKVASSYGFLMAERQGSWKLRFS
jgi:glycosyltransferase involved in cell wall biosynthesis